MMTSPEPTYTLDDARRVFAHDECARHGHSWNIIESAEGGPIGLACDSCGWTGAVTMRDRPESPRTARRTSTGPHHEH